MLDYEPLLRSLGRSITWLPFDGAYQFPSLITKKGVITVPSSYDLHEESVDFNITFWRHSLTDEPADFHVFFLNGGPGAFHAGPVEHLLGHLKHYRVAYYHMHHRGLGESGSFLENGVEFLRTTENAQRLIQHGPFPAKHLTTHNASLDVSTIILALQKEDNFNPKSTFHLIGGSYGALHVNQTSRLTPNLFESVYMFIIPAMRGTGPETGRGVAESCEMSSFCRSYLGPNPWDSFKDAIKAVVRLENQCAQTFFNLFHSDSFQTEADRVQALIQPFFPLAYQEVEELRQEGFEQIQYLFAFIKATGDCLHPERYEAEVLNVMKPYFDDYYLVSKPNSFDFPVSPSDWKAQFNEFVKEVVSFDTHCYAGPKSRAPKGHYDIYMNLSMTLSMEYNFNIMGHLLSGMKHTEHFPLKSPKTRVFIANGRLDLITPYTAAWDIFNQVEAPEKTWILQDPLGHEYVVDSCWGIQMTEFLGITQDPRKIEKCLEEFNQNKTAKWTFDSRPSIANIWNHIRKAPHHHTNRMSTPKFDIPNYARVASATKVKPISQTLARPTLSYLFYSNVVLIAFIGLFVTSAVVLVLFLFRQKGNKSVNAQTAETVAGL